MEQRNAHAVEFTFQGQKISLLSKGDPNQIAEAVDIATQKLMEVQEKASGAPLHKVAIVALLDLAEQFVQARRQVAEYQTSIQDKTEELLKVLHDETDLTQTGV
jgi:hypothetical protein